MVPAGYWLLLWSVCLSGDDFILENGFDGFDGCDSPDGFDGSRVLPSRWIKKPQIFRVVGGADTPNKNTTQAQLSLQVLTTQ